MFRFVNAFAGILIGLLLIMMFMSYYNKLLSNVCWSGWILFGRNLKFCLIWVVVLVKVVLYCKCVILMF